MNQQQLQAYLLDFPTAEHLALHHDLAKSVKHDARQQQRIEFFHPMEHKRTPPHGSPHHRRGQTEAADKDEQLHAIMPKVAEQEVDELTRLLSQHLKQSVDIAR